MAVLHHNLYRCLNHYTAPAYRDFHRQAPTTLQNLASSTNEYHQQQKNTSNPLQDSFGGTSSRIVGNNEVLCAANSAFLVFNTAI